MKVDTAHTSVEYWQAWVPEKPDLASSLREIAER